jgi:hypothetical protein
MIAQTSRANILLNFLGDGTQTSVFGEVAIDLAVPGGIVAFPDKGSELCQLIRRQGVYGSLYFGDSQRECIGTAVKAQCWAGWKRSFEEKALPNRVWERGKKLPRR